MSYWVKFWNRPDTGGPRWSAEVRRPDDWEPAGRSYEETTDNAIFFGPYPTREVAAVVEQRVWNKKTRRDADGFTWWR